jgi:hypothetical protein
MRRDPDVRRARLTFVVPTGVKIPGQRQRIRSGPGERESGGAVKPRDGDERNAAPDNLLVARYGGNSFGGKASSLVKRASANTTLINALAADPHASVAQLSVLTGSTKPCTCVRSALRERLSRFQSCGVKALRTPGPDKAGRWAGSGPILAKFLWFQGKTARWSAPYSRLPRMLAVCPSKLRLRPVRDRESPAHLPNHTPLAPRLNC